MVVRKIRYLQVIRRVKYGMTDNGGGASAQLPPLLFIPGDDEGNGAWHIRGTHRVKILNLLPSSFLN